MVPKCQRLAPPRVNRSPRLYIDQHPEKWGQEGIASWLYDPAKQVIEPIKNRAFTRSKTREFTSTNGLNLGIEHAKHNGIIEFLSKIKVMQ